MRTASLGLAAVLLAAPFAAADEPIASSAIEDAAPAAALHTTHGTKAETAAPATPDRTPRADTATKDAPKVISGMSILGNQEAPKSLVIVPWKSSEIGAAPGLSRLLNDAARPVDREVFMRELAYHSIRVE
jgi:hypothetical protein